MTLLIPIDFSITPLSLSSLYEASSPIKSISLSHRYNSCTERITFSLVLNEETVKVSLVMYVSLVINFYVKLFFLQVVIVF